MCIDKLICLVKSVAEKIHFDSSTVSMKFKLLIGELEECGWEKETNVLDSFYIRSGIKASKFR